MTTEGRYKQKNVSRCSSLSLDPNDEDFDGFEHATPLVQEPHYHDAGLDGGGVLAKLYIPA